MTQHWNPRLIWMIALLVCFSIAPAIFSCNDGDETNYDDDDDDDNDTGFIDDDDDNDDGDDIPPNAPIVNAVTSPTALLEQTITGIAEPDSMVTVQGGANSASSPADPVNGDFCVVVDLIMNQDNELSITATDEWLNTSEATTVIITQDRSLLPAERNGSLTGTATAASTSSTECEGCTPDKTNDDNLTTHWQNSTNTITNPQEATRDPQWVGIDLGEEYVIDHAEVLWGEDYGTHYSLWYSNYPSPVPPHESLEQWTIIQEVGNGNGNTDEIVFEEPVSARHYALILITSSHKNTFTNKYYYQVVEFKLFGAPSSEYPVDPGCE